MNRGNFKASAETRVIKTTEAEIFRNPKADGTAGKENKFGNLVIFCEKSSDSILMQSKELLLKRSQFCGKVSERGAVAKKAMLRCPCSRR